MCNIYCILTLVIYPFFFLNKTLKVIVLINLFRVFNIKLFTDKFYLINTITLAIPNLKRFREILLNETIFKLREFLNEFESSK